MNEEEILKEADQLFNEGYRAASVDTCPYPKVSSGPYVLWMQGWHERQRHRAMVDQAQAQVWCKNPLGSAYGAAAYD